MEKLVKIWSFVNRHGGCHLLDPVSTTFFRLSPKINKYETSFVFMNCLCEIINDSYYSDVNLSDFIAIMFFVVFCCVVCVFVYDSNIITRNTYNERHNARNFYVTIFFLSP